MGIHNRDYFQPPDDRLSPVSSGTIVTKIVLITVGVFLLQLLTGDQTPGSQVTRWLALDHELVFRSGQVWRLLSYGFCHSESRLMHIVCNMFALFFLGRIVAQTLGSREFLAVYLTAVVFSGIVQASSLAVFAKQQTIVLGASGAVSAVFMLFALHYPRLKLLIFGVIPIQARWLLAIVVGYDGLGFLGLVPSVFVPDGARVGHAAHLGGLIFGLLYFRWNMSLTGWWDRAAGRVSQTEFPKHDLKIYRPAEQPEMDLSDRVDEILAKISRDGEESLTQRERRILAQASEQLNNTR